MRNYRSVLLLVALLFALNVDAQTKRTKYYEFGAGIGTLNMSNEIANSSRVNAVFAEIDAQISIFAKYHVNDWFGFGGEISFGNLNASDANHDNFNRGFSVNTSLVTGNLFSEIHLIRFGKYHLDQKHTIFLKGGIGVAGWNPELQIAGLVPENIDIETDAYIGMNTFVGLGVKYRVSYHGIITAELRYSTVGGDTMDGILETAPNIISDNDKFWGVMFSYSYAIL
ncbi:MAG: hypothetical protein DA405_01520 [Bacteroidetes bacterium]|nr:MAG: hypothetical protein DA405_01520 [Bacteroidota bacterium]